MSLSRDQGQLHKEHAMARETNPRMYLLCPVCDALVAVSGIWISASRPEFLLIVRCDPKLVASKGAPAAMTALRQRIHGW